MTIAVMIGAVISISPVLRCNLIHCDCVMMLVIYLIGIVVMAAPWC
jgi:hypothetical protein